MAQLSKTLESKQEPPGTPGTIFPPYQLLEPAAEAKRKKQLFRHQPKKWNP